MSLETADKLRTLASAHASMFKPLEIPSFLLKFHHGHRIHTTR